MTTLPTFVFHGVGATHLDDNMDTTSSPVRQADEIDLDLDQMREPSPGPNVDNMMDDATESGDNNDYLLADNLSRTEEDRMSVAEHFDAADAEDLVRDFDMDALDVEEVQYHDEEILYDEDTFVDHQEEHQYVEPHSIDEDRDESTEHTEHQYTGPDDEEFRNEDQFTVPTGEDDEIDNPTLLTTEGDTDDEYEEEEVPQEALHVSPGTNTVVEQEEPQHEQQTFLDQQITQPTTKSDDQIEETGAETIPYNLGDEQTPQKEAVVTQEQSVDTSQDDTNRTENDHAATNESTLVDPSQAEQSGSESQTVPHPSSLHDVKLLYLDVSLAFEKLTRLLEACREILADSIGHDDELVLDIPALALHICEDSKYAEQLTLSQIIDVYMALNQNEQAAPIVPMYCSLSSRVCLASQYAYLVSAAQEGRKFSEVASDYVDSPEDEYNATVDFTQPELPNFADDDRGEAEHAEDADDGDHYSSTLPEASDDLTVTKLDSGQSLDRFQNMDDDKTADEIEIPNPDIQVVVEIGKESDTNPADQLRGDLHEAADMQDEHDSTHNDDASEQSDHDDHQTTQAGAGQIILDDHVAAAEEEPELVVDDEAYVQENKNDSNLQVPAESELATDAVPADEYEAFDDEEFFLKSDDEQQTEADADDQDIFDDSALNEQTAEETTHTNGHHNDHDSATSLLQNTTNVLPEEPQPTPLATPAKAVPLKRKVLEDDDEFDLLDSSTPEPKRNRSS